MPSLYLSARVALTSLCGLLAATLAGCGTGTSNIASSPIKTAASEVMQGSVHGGQQPVSGSSIQLYAASTTGYGTQARAMLTVPVLTDAGGGFSLSPGGLKLYTCQAGDLVYLVANGGNPGISALTNNQNLVLMAALGPCSNLSTSTYISVNEVSTVAAVYALSPFASATHTTTAGGYDFSYIGTSATNLTGLQNAFASVNNLVSLGSGSVYATTPAGNGTVSAPIINSLADVLATCVNSDGTAACSTLKSTVGAPAADTYTAALTMARQPYANVASILSLPTASAPFQPTALTTSNDLSVYVAYTGTNLSTVTGMGIDAAGNVWVTNNPVSGTPALAEFSNLGVPLKTVSNILTAPECLSIDGNQNIWVTNNTKVDQFTSTGAYLGSLVPTLPSGTKLNFCATDINNNFYAAPDYGTGTVGVATTNYFQFQNTSPAVAPSFVSPAGGYSIVGPGNSQNDVGTIPLGVGNPVADSQGNVIFVDMPVTQYIDVNNLGEFTFDCARYRAFNAGNLIWTHYDGTLAAYGVSQSTCGVQLNASFNEFSVPVLDANNLMVAGSGNFARVIGGENTGDTPPGYDYISTIRRGEQNGLLTYPYPVNNLGGGGASFAFQYLYGGVTGNTQPAAANHMAVSGTNQYFGSHTVNTGTTGLADYPYIVWETSTGSAANGFTFKFVATPNGLLPNNIGQTRDLAIDGSGNLWVNSTPLNSTSIVGLFEIIGVASPTITPYGASIANKKIGQLP